jgi:hypothetical protein
VSLSCVRILALATVLVAAVDARAVLLAWDNFETPGAGVALNGQTTGSGWTTSWSALSFLTIVETNNGGSTPTLAYARNRAQVATGNRAAMIGDGGTAALDNVFSREFAPRNSTIYFSLVVKQLAGQDSSSDFVQFNLTEDLDYNNSGSVGFGQVAEAQSIFARMRDSNDTAATPGVNVEQGKTYLLVGKLWKSTGSTGSNFDRMSIFVNPTNVTELANPFVTASRSSGISTMDTLLGRIARLDPGDQILFDELRIGTTFGDVLPEPASLSAAVLATAGLLMRRRRSYTAP